MMTGGLIAQAEAMDFHDGSAGPRHAQDVSRGAKNEK